MKAYCDENMDNDRFVVLVVTEQDYHERGPHAYSFRATSDSLGKAREHANAWAKRNGYTMATVDEVAA